METWSVIFGMLGVIGTVFGFWAYFRTKARRELTWKAAHTQIMAESESDISGLSIRFEDNPITTLKSTVIEIENTGNHDLNGGADLLNDVWFAIAIKPEDLLTARLPGIDKERHEETNPNKYDVKISSQRDKIFFTFKYMIKKDVARIQILHKSSEDPAITTEKASIIKDGKVIEERPSKKSRPIASSILLAIAGIVAVTMAALLVAIAFDIDYGNYRDAYGSILWCVVGLFFAIVMFTIGTSLGKKAKKFDA